MIEELINLLKNEGHCTESINELQVAENFADIFNMLFDYRVELAKKRFPTIEIVRKFYQKSECIFQGIFCDEKYLIDNMYKMILFNSDCVVHVGNYQCSHIVLRHNSKIKLFSGYHASINIYQCEESEIEIIEKGEKSTINIRKL